MGVARETSITIAGRAGAIPYVTAEDITIPGQVTAVELPLISADGKKVVPFNPGYCGLEEIKISGGGYGKISVEIDENTQERTYTGRNYNRNVWSNTLLGLSSGYLYWYKWRICGFGGFDCTTEGND